MSDIKIAACKFTATPQAAIFYLSKLQVVKILYFSPINPKKRAKRVFSCRETPRRPMEFLPIASAILRNMPQGIGKSGGGGSRRRHSVAVGLENHFAVVAERVETPRPHNNMVNK